MSEKSDPAMPPASDDRTVIRTAATSGAAEASTDNALPAGHRLREFEIGEVIGEGGFSIVYIAHDTNLDRKVAIKEYIPSCFVRRGRDHAVTLKSDRHRETFELGRRSFINEGRLLASLNHESLIKVYQYWEQNDTAYLAMPFYSGSTLKAVRQAMSQPPDEAWLRRMLAPLLDALLIIHAEHIYHRDIAADNILLMGAEQRPLLLDFGSARRVIGDADQALTVIVKPGYAPIEQYAESPSLKQGPWTDVYAVCAVLYMLITGRAPIASVSRVLRDDLPPISVVAAGRYSVAFLAAIDRGLAVQPHDRLQDIAALRRALSAEDVGAPEGRTQTGPYPEGATFAQDGGIGAKTRRSRLIVSAIGVVVVACAATLWMTTHRAASLVEAERPATGAPIPAVVVSPPTAAPAAMRNATFDIAGVFDEIIRHADPLISINALADQDTVVIGRDHIGFRVRSSVAGYLYVLYNGTDGPDLTLLFPNRVQKDNRVAADKVVTLPGPDWKAIRMFADGPAGTDRFVVIVSAAPRDLSGMGLVAGDPVSTFDLATLRRLWDEPVTMDTPYAGRVTCTDAAACPTGYGATLLRIEEVSRKR